MRHEFSAPGARAKFHELRSPALNQAPRVCFVTRFATWRRTDVVSDHAAERDERHASAVARAQAEIDVFAAVEKSFVEAAHFVPKISPHEQASSCARDDFAGARPRVRERAQVRWLALGVDKNAGVVDQTRFEV